MRQGSGQLSKIESNGFGSLLSQGNAGAAQEAADAIAPTTVAGRGRGGGLAYDSKMIAPMPIEYKYKYSGDKFELNDLTVPVLRRKTGEAASLSIINQIKSMNLGIADLSSFASAKMQNLSFYEDRDFGYYVDVNFRDSSISIYENWEKWDSPLSRCADQRCYNENQLTIDDIPSDEELILIANGFLSQYGIVMDSYKDPEVVDDWRISYDAAADKQYAWVPDQIQIRYSLIVEGETVYDQAGNPFGLTVNVNIRHKRASGAWGLRANQFESSDYEAIADAEKIIAYAESGGMAGLIYYEQNEQTQAAAEVELGTPERVLVQIYNYANNKNNELLVPALRFPIIAKSDDLAFFWRSSVIVPLAKELIDDSVLQERKPMPVDDGVIINNSGSSGSGEEDAPLPPEGADIIEIKE